MHANMFTLRVVAHHVDVIGLTSASWCKREAPRGASNWTTDDKNLLGATKK